MAILWAGTSLADYSFYTNGGANTQNGHRAPNVAEAVAVSDALTPYFNPVSEFWLSDYVYWDSQISFSTQSLFEFLSPTGQPVVSVRTNSNKQLLFQAWRSGDWTWIAADTNVLLPNVLKRFDVYLKLHATAGEFKLYLDGALLFSFSGNTSSQNGIVVGALRVRNTYGTGGTNARHSATIVADEDTRKFTFIQRLPDAAGAKQEWTGAYTDINETGYNDTNYITTDVLDEISTFGFADLPSEMAVRNVAALVISGRVRSAGTIGAVEGIARVGSTDYSVSGKFETSPLYGPQNWVFNANPATGQAWLGSDINAAEFGVKAA